MGCVFSIAQFPFRLVESVLTVGVAATACAFYPHNSHYLSGLSAVLPFCESAETEPFEDFSAVLCGLHNDGGSNVIKPSSPNYCCRPGPVLTRTQPNQHTVWRSRTVEAKKLYQAAGIEAQKKAAHFRRRYTLFGPPDWTDPALSLLPPEYLHPPSFAPNVFPSIYPFIAPHIVISPAHDHTDPLVVSANSVRQQDQEFGNRLVVADPPSCSGPRPIIINSAARSPPQVTSQKIDDWADSNELDPEDTPSLTDDTSSSGSSDYCTIDDFCASPSGHVADFANGGRSDKSAYWIVEDEDELPDLPDTWQLQRKSA